MAHNNPLPTPNPLSPNPMDPMGEANLLLPQDEFWENHKSKILAGVLAIVVVALGAVGVTAWQSKARSEAAAALAQASAPAEWRAVWEAHPRTPAGVNAALLLAAALRNEGDLPASSAVYEALLAQKGGIEALLPEAALGLAQNGLLQSPENPSAAVEAFREVAARFPGKPAAAVALLTEGEILVQAKQEAEAAAVFRNLMADYPGSIPARVASAQLQAIAPKLPTETAETAETAPKSDSSDPPANP